MKQNVEEECAMKRETTPLRVTDKIIELCSGIVPSLKPKYVSVEAQEWSLPSECFLNVERMVQEQGGRQINGWAIWQWANILVEAEAHSVWQSPEGRLVDITPHDNRETDILFLADPDMVYDNNTIASVRSALTSSPLVAELIHLMNERDRIMCVTPGRMCKIPKSLLIQIMQIQMVLHMEVGRNDPCPCQSGLKYKKCCGRN